MASDIQQYQQAEGLSDAEMAALISERLGRPVSETGYRVVKGRRSAPLPWLEALNIAPREPEGSSQPPSSGGDDDTGAAPQQGKSALAPVPLPFEPASAAMQIQLIYTMAGKGIALSTRRTGTRDALMRAQNIETIWAQNAPAIAAAYIEWARENSTVARYIGMLTLGGAGGKVLLLHGSLFVQTLIQSGAVDPQQFVPPGLRNRTPQETDLINEDDDGDDGAAEPTTEHGASA